MTNELLSLVFYTGGALIVSEALVHARDGKSRVCAGLREVLNHILAAGLPQSCLSGSTELRLVMVDGQPCWVCEVQIQSRHALAGVPQNSVVSQGVLKLAWCTWRAGIRNFCKSDHVPDREIQRGRSVCSLMH